MARIYNTFNFVGQIAVPKEDQFHKVAEATSGWVGHRLNFGVKESQNNAAFVELYGGYSKAKPNKVFSFSKRVGNEDGGKLEIPWDVRNDKSTIRQVADFKKIVVDYTDNLEEKQKQYELRGEIRAIESKEGELTHAEREKLNQLYDTYELTGNRKEFVHTYDAIQYLKDTLPEYKDKQFIVRGQIDYQEYTNAEGVTNTYRKFNPQVIQLLVPKEGEEPKNKLSAELELYFHVDSMDDKDFKKDKIITLNGYIQSYDSDKDVKKDRFFRQQTVINATALDFENEAHMKRLDYMKKQFEVASKDKKKVFRQLWEVKVFRGADEEEFTMDKLTDSQREQVELGLATLDSFKKKVYGQAVEQIRLVKPILEKRDDANNFVNGRIETALEIDQLTFVKPQSSSTQSSTTDSLPKELQGEKKEVELENLDDLF